LAFLPIKWNELNQTWCYSKRNDLSRLCSEQNKPRQRTSPPSLNVRQKSPPHQGVRHKTIIPWKSLHSLLFLAWLAALFLAAKHQL
jgi:hypothetical protein